VDEQSNWKKEFTFERKPKGENEDAPAVDETSEPEEVVADEPVAEEPVWTKEVSFSPTPEPEPVAEELAWTSEVSFTPTPEPEPVAPVVAEPVVAEPEPVVEEPVAVADESAVDVEESVPFWKKDISFGGKKRAKTPKPVTETEQRVPFWKKEISLGKKRAKTEDPAVAEVTEPVIHPPVPASELPPEPGEKVPFWKKDISLGGKKGERKPKPQKERRSKEPKVKAPRGGSSKGRIVGLKIGASQLAAARVANNGSAELQQLAREPLAPGIVVGGELRDPEALSAALKDFFAKHKLPTKGVRLGIANNRIGVRTFEIAGVTEQKQLDNAIRFRAQEALPIPIDEAVLDYQVLGEGTDEEGQPTRRILLVVAYRELIDRYVAACRKAGIVLSGIDLEAFALLRALQAPQAGVGNDPSAALVAVAIGHERSTFAVSDGRVCEFTRVLEWGGSALNVALARVLDTAPSEVDDVKHELTLTDSTVPEGLTAEQATTCVEALRKAIQTFARELVSSLQYYQNQPGSLGIGEIVLTGGTAHLPGLAQELESLIGVRVRVGNPLARMKVAKRVGEPERIGSLAVAIGLGIED
jgi:type IV pilus assembly protein PilM